MQYGGFKFYPSSQLQKTTCRYPSHRNGLFKIKPTGLIRKHTVRKSCNCKASIIKNCSPLNVQMVQGKKRKITTWYWKHIGKHFILQMCSVPKSSLRYIFWMHTRWRISFKNFQLKNAIHFQWWILSPAFDVIICQKQWKQKFYYQHFTPNIPGASGS